MRAIQIAFLVVLFPGTGCKKPKESGADTGTPPVARSEYDVPTAGTIIVQQVSDEWYGVAGTPGTNPYPYDPLIKTDNRAKINDHYVGKRWNLALQANQYAVRADHLSCAAVTGSSNTSVKVFFRNKEDLVNFPDLGNDRAAIEGFRLSAYCVAHDKFVDAVIVK